MLSNMTNLDNSRVIGYIRR